MIFDTDKFCFRIAEQADIPMVLMLYRRQVGRFGSTWNEHYPDCETARHDLDNGLLYVLLYDEMIIGAISVGITGEVAGMPVLLSKSHPCEIARICVSPQYSGYGLGKMLIQYAERLCATKAFDYIRLLVAKCNLPAIGMYTSCGFRCVGEAFEYGIDFYQYVKEL